VKRLVKRSRIALPISMIWPSFFQNTFPLSFTRQSAYFVEALDGLSGWARKNCQVLSTNRRPGSDFTGERMASRRRPSTIPSLRRFVDALRSLGPCRMCSGASLDCCSKSRLSDCLLIPFVPERLSSQGHTYHCTQGNWQKL